MAAQSSTWVAQGRSRDFVLQKRAELHIAALFPRAPTLPYGRVLELPTVDGNVRRDRDFRKLGTSPGAEDPCDDNVREMVLPQSLKEALGPGQLFIV